MFFKMTRFEWRYFTRQPSFIVTCLIFFLLPFLSVTIDNVQIGASSNININSPHAIAQTLLIFGIFSLFLVVNFVANTAMRNDVSKMNELIVTRPFSALTYQLGRFCGAYLVCLTVFAMIPIAVLIGSLMPWLDQERLGQFSLMYYVTPYFVFSTTTLFVFSALFYAVALRFRSMMAVYLVALGMFMLYAVLGQIFSEPHQQEIAALLDPFGLNTYQEITRYWTPVERNTETVGFSSSVLANRGLWFAVGLSILLGFGRMFKPLSLNVQSGQARRLSRQEYIPFDNDITAKYSNTRPLQQVITRTLFEMKQVFMSPAFPLLMIFCAFSLIFQFVEPQGIYGAPNWPLTQYMVEMIRGAFGLALIIVITYYSAEVVWRERSVGMGDIVDSMPVSNFTFWLSKFVAVALVIIAVLTVGMLAALFNQLAKGYMNFDFAQYFVSLLYFEALPWILLVVLAFFIQALSPNKYIGMLIFVAYFFVSLAFSQIGLEHNMFNYAASPAMQYSDMNGYGWYLSTQNHYMLYWSALAFVFAAFSYAMWQRGPESSLQSRVRLLAYQLGGAGRAVVVVGALLFVASGTIIHYNTTVTNQFLTADERMDLQSEYEKAFAQFEDSPLPTITDVNINAAIFPEKRRIEVIASIDVVNRSEENIERFLVNLPQYSSDISITMDGGSLAQVHENFDVAWFEFDNVLAPGESASGEIRLVRQHFGFKDRGEDSTLVQNGTFINNYELLPYFGVNQRYYLTDRHERRKRDLPPPRRAYLLEDSSRYDESFFGPNVGLISFAATLSTSEDQLAVAPGYLESYWTEGGRNYFRYEMDSPMIDFYSIMSADLEVKSQRHKGVDITVYYHRDHHWNVDRMIESSIDSLDLFTEAFGPYQHKQLRIIEFPGYRRFAQSFANTVPYSERIGFISDLRDPNTIDPVYYITAHEVAHQWFGHQLNAANVQGSAILSEALSQYAALLVMQKKYGKDKIREFLSYELDSYLRGRTQEILEEMPLMRSEGQQYIHYRKGSIVMMAIADRIGTEALNRALKRLIDQYRFSTSLQPTTLDLLAAIKANAAPDTHAFIEQQFSQITIYDLRLQDLSWTVLDSELDEQNQYEITLNVFAKQFAADGQGGEVEQDFNDEVDIVLFSDDPDKFSAENDIIYQQKHQLKSGENEFSIIVDRLPEFVGVDPFVRFIDRESRDNVRPLER
ncbi:ABC transporter permease/M1 family aminopeptidase [Ningiella sp. W23]|uniref:ABC transporter permease/M1 family aminopeptidase n=1 Tax=Ningiella sp. W23 TaxID=3023715 RepID=UPI0037568F1A